MSSLEKSVMKNKLPPLPTGFGARRGSGSIIHKRHDYIPVCWKKYWDKKEFVKTAEGDSFCTYFRGNSGPLLLLLHGGGYSALTWSLFAEAITDMVECQVIAYDQRGHGDTTTADEKDLCADTLAKDVGRVLNSVFEDSSQPPCVVVGHSMGGAIAVHSAHDKTAAFAGLIVIDVVEGTAMDALSSMQSFLRGRPKNFDTIQNAIEWSIKSGQTRNYESARVSMPGQIKSLKTNRCAAGDLSEVVPSISSGPKKFAEQIAVAADAILEENEESDNPQQNAVPNISANNFTWRVDLGRTEKYWQGWFKDLSRRFLDSLPSKMLLLAGIDRLDTDLTVGQMQGKFQMQVLPQCGHAVHEDVPDRVAEVVANFLIRYQLTKPVGEFNRTFPAC